jgi:L-lactate dehydrogenase complex protein LldG
VTPENRQQMLSVVRKSLSRAYLPGATPDHPGDLAYSYDAARSAARGAASSPEAAASAHANANATSLPNDPANRTATVQALDATGGGDVSALTERFRKELETLAGFTYVAESVDAAAAQVAQIAQRFNAARVLAWDAEAFSTVGVPGLTERLAAHGVACVAQHVPFRGDERRATLTDLDPIGVGLTGADAGLAETGSLVLASGPGRGRLASLLAPVHVAVLRRDRILYSLPDLFRRRPDLAAMPGSNLVCITGPSRTADIEQTLSRGVHGPREVHVVLV